MDIKIKEINIQIFLTTAIFVIFLFFFFFFFFWFFFVVVVLQPGIRDDAKRQEDHIHDKALSFFALLLIFRFGACPTSTRLDIGKNDWYLITLSISQRRTKEIS